MWPISRTSLYCVSIEYTSPFYGVCSEFVSPFIPCFIPDNAIIHRVCAPFVIELDPCPSGQQFDAND